MSLKDEDGGDRCDEEQSFIADIRCPSILFLWTLFSCVGAFVSSLSQCLGMLKNSTARKRLYEMYWAGHFVVNYHFSRGRTRDILS